MGPFSKPAATYNIGELLLAADVITRKDLEEALFYQRASNPRLRIGECLVRMHRLKREHLALILAQQRAVRRGGSDDVLEFARELTAGNIRVTHDAERLAEVAHSILLWEGRHA